MAEGRPQIPRELRRQVLVEAGHRCAIPTCRSIPVEIAHIVPWSEVKEHKFSNLIALCPTCHARYGRGDIDRKSMLIYKQNLTLLAGRYGAFEIRILDFLAQNPTKKWVYLPVEMELLFSYLIHDGILRGPIRITSTHTDPKQILAVPVSVPIQEVIAVPQSGMWSIYIYELTEEGEAFLDRWKQGRPIEETD